MICIAIPARNQLRKRGTPLRVKGVHPRLSRAVEVRPLGQQSSHHIFLLSLTTGDQGQRINRM
jgi:hypothetical protein